MANITIYLSSFGFNDYYITNDGIVYQITNQQQQKQDKRHRLLLKNNNGKCERIPIKKLYRKVFNKEYCIDTIKSFEGEEWKPISNTKEKYFVSSFGRVKSYCGYNAIILKQFTQKSGYLEVKINNKNIKTHQLVAQAFCENRYKNTNIKIEIHHKDRNRQNNNADNLEILSITEHHKKHNRKESKNNE